MSWRQSLNQKIVQVSYGYSARCLYSIPIWIVEPRVGVLAVGREQSLGASTAST